MKYKDLIKKLQPHAEQEVKIITLYGSHGENVNFFDKDGYFICMIFQKEGQQAKFENL